jgi:N-acetylglutamate synthase-like GNAT family acetyltransferase
MRIERERRNTTVNQSNVVVRKMAHDDLEAALEILDKWGMAPRPDLENAERSGIEIGNSFVAETEDGRIVGVASYIVHDSQRAETASLAVDPEVRGTGVGYQLQQARLKEMNARGIQKVRTETDRPETIDWYVRKFGYRIVGTSPKKHPFSLADVDEWTVLEMSLRPMSSAGSQALTHLCPAPDANREVCGRKERVQK